MLVIFLLVQAASFSVVRLSVQEWMLSGINWIMSLPDRRMTILLADISFRLGMWFYGDLVSRFCLVISPRLIGRHCGPDMDWTKRRKPDEEIRQAFFV